MIIFETRLKQYHLSKCWLLLNLIISSNSIVVIVFIILIIVAVVVMAVVLFWGPIPPRPGVWHPSHLWNRGAEMRAVRAEARRVQPLIHPYGWQKQPFRRQKCSQSSRRASSSGCTRRCSFSFRAFQIFVCLFVCSTSQLKCGDSRKCWRFCWCCGRRRLHRIR